MPDASTTRRNIQTIGDLEKAALAERPLSAYVGDIIATEAGKMWFIVCHIIWFAVWIGLNQKGSKYVFDPYPYSLLTMVVSLESIFLSLFILMSQNRSSIQADRRNHLDLQINLLAEDENTKMIQMLQVLCQHHKLSIGKDPEVEAMAQRTEVKEVLTELDEHLPEQA